MRKYFAFVINNLPFLTKDEDDQINKKSLLLLIEFFLSMLTIFPKMAHGYGYCFSVAFDTFFILIIFISLLYSEKIFKLKIELLPFIIFYNACYGPLLNSPFYTILHLGLFVVYLRETNISIKRKILSVFLFFFALTIVPKLPPMLGMTVASAEVLFFFPIFLFISISMIIKIINKQPHYMKILIFSLFLLCFFQFFGPYSLQSFFAHGSRLSDAMDVSLYNYSIVRIIIIHIVLLTLYICIVFYMKEHNYQDSRKIVSIYYISYLITHVFYYREGIIFLAILIFYLSFINKGKICFILFYISASIIPLLALKADIECFQSSLAIGHFLLKTIMAFLLYYLNVRKNNKNIQKAYCT